MSEVRFIANLCNRQSALMLSGDGQRCLVELEAFGVNAAEALRLAIFAGKEIEVSVKLADDDRQKRIKSSKF